MFSGNDFGGICANFGKFRGAIFRFCALCALCPRNFILGCRLPWCLSNFGRFLLVADQYSLSNPVTLSLLTMLVRFETHSHLEKTGSFFQEVMAGHSASIFVEHVNFSVSFM